MQVLTDLTQWSQGKQLVETQTFGANAAEGQAEQLPVYLLDIRGEGDNWLLTLWNQTPATEGKVASISTNSVVGRAGVVMNELAPNTVPGFATYFYFIPSLSAVAAVRFQHLAFGHVGMKNFMSGFIRQFTRYVQWSDTPNQDGSLEILGYAMTMSNQPENLIPYFNSELMKQAGERDLLIQRARDIRKVVRKTELNNGRRPDRALWQRLLQRAGMTAAPEIPAAVRVEYELPAKFEPDEMKALQDRWDIDNANMEDWDDVGFVLKGEQTPHWLSKSVARGTHDLDVERESLELVNPASLLQQLTAHRTALTAMIHVDQRVAT
ncbi:hypothetical protein [Aquabacterium sp. A08]|uniref:hypothetical protein n=1 Tax=Aquabacterium sp. A08 TaxID=2718532 RepID=UPI001423F452|nr:hypothetical protein [Aquabacterium sp. A08]NIC42179.1 hypothetical protein [Aquabacterium sp. A08]